MSVLLATAETYWSAYAEEYELLYTRFGCWGRFLPPSYRCNYSRWFCDPAEKAVGMEDFGSSSLLGKLHSSVQCSMQVDLRARNFHETN